jgi:hypothetical protein
MYGVGWWRGKAIFEHYADTGRTTLDGKMIVGDPSSVAHLLATTEHNLRAAIIEQLQSMIDNSHLMHGDHGPEYVYTDSILNLIDDLRAQQ